MKILYILDYQFLLLSETVITDFFNVSCYCINIGIIMLIYLSAFEFFPSNKVNLLNLLFFSPYFSLFTIYLETNCRNLISDIIH